MSGVWRALVIVSGLAVVVGLVVQAGVAEVAGMLARVGWVLAPVSGLYGGHVGLRALALWRGLPDHALPFRDVLRVRVAGEAVELLTFSGPWLAEPAKGWLLTRHGVSTPLAFGTIALEYLLYSMAASWMAAISIALLLERRALPPALAAPALGLEAAIAAITIGFLFAAVSGRGLIVLALRSIAAPEGRVAAFARRIDPAERVIVDFLSRRRLRLLEVLAIEAFGHLLLAAEIAIVFRAARVDPRWSDALVFEGASKFIGAVFFFVPGQVGAQEGGYTLIAAALGVPASAGLTLALARRIRNVIVGLASLAALWPSSGASPPGGKGR